MANINIAKEDFEKVGFFDLGLDTELDLFAAIDNFKKKKNAVVLAYYYQEPDIQDVADFTGDSLSLSQEARKMKADLIVFAGVHFMAETAKILNPLKKVLLPDLKAGYSLSDSAPSPLFKAFRDKQTNHKVIIYINCSP